jgi:hypothetical protein
MKKTKMFTEEVVDTSLEEKENKSERLFNPLRIRQ